MQSSGKDAACCYCAVCCCIAACDQDETLAQRHKIKLFVSATSLFSGGSEPRSSGDEAVQTLDPLASSQVPLRGTVLYGAALAETLNVRCCHYARFRCPCLVRVAPCSTLRGQVPCTCKYPSGIDVVAVPVHYAGYRDDLLASAMRMIRQAPHFGRQGTVLYCTVPYRTVLYIIVP